MPQEHEQEQGPSLLQAHHSTMNVSMTRVQRPAAPTESSLQTSISPMSSQISSVAWVCFR